MKQPRQSPRLSCFDAPAFVRRMRVSRLLGLGRSLAAAAPHAAVMAARAPAEAVSAAPANAGTTAVDRRAIEVAAVSPVPMAPVASAAANFLHRTAFGRVGLDRLTGSAREGCGGRKLRCEGCPDRDGRGKGKSFQSHVSLLDIVGPACAQARLPEGRANKHRTPEHPMNSLRKDRTGMRAKQVCGARTAPLTRGSSPRIRS